MHPGIDTILLTTQEFKVNPTRHKLQVDRTYVGTDGGELLDLNKPLFGDVHGRKAFYNHKVGNDVFGAFTISERGLKVQFSPPKIYHGNNAKDFEAKYTSEILKNVEGWAREAGILVNLYDCRVSRLDLPKNARCDHAYGMYAPLISRINNRNSLEVSYSNTYIRNGNNNNQVCFYLKDAQHNLLRLEPRLLTGKGVKAMAKKVGEINARTVSDQGLLNEIYRKAVIEKVNIATMQKDFMRADNRGLQFSYLYQKSVEDAMAKKNKAAYALMQESDGIEWPIKNLTVPQLLSIKAKVLSAFVDPALLDIGSKEMFAYVERNYSGPGKWAKKSRLKAKQREIEPDVITDEIKHKIIQEFNDKFLTL